MNTIPADSPLPQACPVCQSQPIEDGYVASGASYSPVPPFFRRGDTMECAAFACGVALYVDPHPDHTDIGAPQIFAPAGEHMGHQFSSDCQGESLDAWLTTRNAELAAQKAAP